MKYLCYMIIYLFSFSVFAAENCAQYSNDCEYYSCIEKIRHCGQKGYPINFGKKYCNKFEKKMHLFSHSGKKWVSRVRGCLIRNLDTFPLERSCSKFQKIAVKQHVPCYLEAGFCRLSTADKIAVSYVIKASMWMPNFISTAFEVLTRCRRSFLVNFSIQKLSQVKKNILKPF